MSGYLYQAQPKPVQAQHGRKSKAKYREQEESKEPLRLTLMSDRRVVRGSTYAPSQRTQPLLAQTQAAANARPSKAPTGSSNNRSRMNTAQPSHPLPYSAMPRAQEIHGHGSSSTHMHHDASSPLDNGGVDFMRVATPEPVAGRQHMIVQTDTYLEDLRRSRQSQQKEFATQTDVENDRPTSPLFTPQSSGTDVATSIDPEALVSNVQAHPLFDFNVEVEAILGVLVEKCLAQGFVEVCEEEELKELQAHQAFFQQARNRRLATVQKLEARDIRRAEERDRRMKQEQERIEKQRQDHQAKEAARLAKQLLNDLEKKVLSTLDEQGHFYDPVRREVEKVFMPNLIQQTAESLRVYKETFANIDEILIQGMKQLRARSNEEAQRRDKQRMEELIRYKLAVAEADQAPASATSSSSSVKPVPSRAIIDVATRFGQEEHLVARRALQSPSAYSSALKQFNAAPDADQRASKKAEEILRDKRAKEAAARKYQRDIIRIQSLARGRRDRKRAAELLAKKRLEAERAAMSPGELLVSLQNEIGFTLQQVDASEDDDNGEDGGADQFLVASINLPFGPAAQAGLVEGDRIVAINDVPLTSIDQLTPASLKTDPFNCNPGDTLRLDCIRSTSDGRHEVVELEVGCPEAGYNQQEIIRDLRRRAELEVPEMEWIVDAESAREKIDKIGGGKFGAAVAADSKSTRGGGARLSKVTDGSAAARAGLKEGDIIVSMNNQPVTDGKSFSAALKEHQAGDVLVLQCLSADVCDQVNNGDLSITQATQAGELVKRVVELGAGGKQPISVEQVRAWRKMAGMPVFKQQ